MVNDLNERENVMLSRSIEVMVVLVLLVFFSFLPNCHSVPLSGRDFDDDRRMEVNFQEHEADFDLLVRMAATDSDVIRIAPDFTWLASESTLSKPGFSEERWNEYRSLFAKLHLENGLMRYSENGRVYLFAKSNGLVTGGKSKGYVYSTTDVSPLYPSLDDLDLRSLETKKAFKRLQSNWYLYLEWE